jgi:hypothetical protein
MARLEKWTLEESNKLVDGLEKWMLTPTQLYYKGKKTGTLNKNVFWKEYLYEQGVFPSVLTHIRQIHPSIDERLNNLAELQEERLQKLAFEGYGKENITKFILQNRFGWKEKTESTDTHILKNLNINDLIGFEDNE